MSNQEMCVFDVIERLLKKAKEYKPDHLSGAKTGESFLWFILSALRGYDGFKDHLTEEEYYRLKELTTCRIRSILGLNFDIENNRKAPLTEDEIKERDELLKKIGGEAKGSHFENHFRIALGALKELQYDVPWKEDNKNLYGVSTQQ